MGISESASSSKKRPPPVYAMGWDAYNSKYRAVLLGKKIVIAPARITKKRMTFSLLLFLHRRYCLL
jgi:hypothetical protein